MSVQATPCAYCGRETMPDDATGAPWEWPGKGRVVACKRCGGYRANAFEVDTGEGVTWQGVDYTVDQVERVDDKIRLHLVDPEANDVEVLAITLEVGDPVEMWHRNGW